MSSANPADVPRVELAVVGGGNMGAALLAGLLEAGSIEPRAVSVVELDAVRRTELAERFPDAFVTDRIPHCDAAVLAVKPPDIAQVASAAALAGARRVLSIAAGVTTQAIAAAIDEATGRAGDVAVLRAMPNTPSLVGEGMAAVTAGPGASDTDLDWAEGILAAVGRCVRVDEGAFDAVTALTGSGPAYVFFLAEALLDAGLDAGLPAGLVDEMVAQLLVGSSALLAARGDPAGLRAMVTSPGGTTAAGVAELESHGVRDAVLAAVRAATERSRELGR